MSALVPYAALLGVTIAEADGDAPVLTMPFGPRTVGRPGFVHGGALGGLLELAAIAALRGELAGTAATIKPVNLSVDYMRGGRDRDTHAQATIRRLGRRIANVDVLAWQDERARPIASARLTFLLRRDADSGTGED